MTNPRKTNRELEADGLALMDRKWSTTTLRAAGNDPELRRMVLAEHVWIAYRSHRDPERLPVTGAQWELLQAVRIWTPFQAYIRGDLLALGERVAGAREVVEASMKPRVSKPEPPERAERRRLDAVALRLMRRARGLPPGPSPERQRLAEAGREASRRAQADVTHGLSHGGLRVVMSIVRVALREIPDLDDAEAEALRWATSAGGDVHGPLDDVFQEALGLEGLALSRATSRRSLLPDVLDLVRRRLANPDSTTQNPKG